MPRPAIIDHPTPSRSARRATLGSAARTVAINGIAKGAGMIAPDMATMLSFVATDAPVAADVLQMMLAEAASETFNCISIDGDTSTSDTLLAFATGAAAKRGAPSITNARDPALDLFNGVS